MKSRLNTDRLVKHNETGTVHELRMDRYGSGRKSLNTGRTLCGVWTHYMRRVTDADEEHFCGRCKEQSDG